MEFRTRFGRVRDVTSVDIESVLFAELLSFQQTGQAHHRHGVSLNGSRDSCIPSIISQFLTLPLEATYFLELRVFPLRKAFFPLLLGVTSATIVRTGSLEASRENDHRNDGIRPG